MRAGRSGKQEGKGAGLVGCWDLGGFHNAYQQLDYHWLRMVTGLSSGAFRVYASLVTVETKARGRLSICGRWSMWWPLSITTHLPSPACRLIILHSHWERYAGK